MSTGMQSTSFVVSKDESHAEYVLTQIPSILDLKFSTEFINPRNVESITFCGEILRDTHRVGDGGA